MLRSLIANGGTCPVLAEVKPPAKVKLLQQLNIAGKLHFNQQQVVPE
jgi:hypothetical protein